MTQIEPAAEGSDEPVAPRLRPSRPYRAAAIALAAALLLVVALVAAAPFWAPLLPWGEGTAEATRALGARLDRLAAAQQQGEQQVQQQAHQEAAAASAAMQRLERRVAALEARPPPAAAGDIGELREQVAKLSAATAELDAKMAASDKAAQQRPGGATDTALALALLQIRDAVEVGRPFAAEFDAMAALAQARPDVAAAIQPLAEPAKTGVASRLVLMQRLRDLSRSLASAPPPPAASAPPADWGAATLARLRGLVSIHRVDGGPSGGAPDPLSGAGLALAGGDLAAAVAALDKLAGPAVDAAAPWLRMARQRLAVDNALQRTEALLTGRLGSAAAPATSR